jgi:general secretion pathway protein D
MNLFRISVTFIALIFGLTAVAWSQTKTAQTINLNSLSGAVVEAPLPEASASDTSLSEAKIKTMRGSGVVIAPSTEKPIAPGPGSAFRFEEAPIGDVVRLVLADILKVDYVLHPPIAGSVTMATRGEVSADQAVMLLEGALQANGLQMARDTRGVYHVGRPDSLKGVVAAPRQATGGPLPPGHGAVIVQLEYIGAAEMASILRPPLVPAEALVRVDTVRNLLILVGTRTQAEGWLSMVATFDVDLFKGMSVGVFPLKYASVKDIEAALNLWTAGTTSGTTGAPGAAPSGTPPAAQSNAATSAAGGAGARPALTPSAIMSVGPVRVMSMERINSILVVTPNPRYLDEARQWIEQLDQPSNSGDAQLFVYPVQNGSAKHLAAVLSGLFGSGGSGGAAGTTGVAPGLVSGSGVAGGFGSAPGGFSGNSLSGGFGGNTGGFGSGGFAGGTGGFGNSLSGMSTTLGAQNLNRPGGTVAPTITAVNVGQGVRVIADEINNAILVYGDRRDYMKIEAALKRLDVAPIQVMIEASIVEVTLGDDLQYGLQWTFADSARGGGPTGGFSGSGALSAAAGGTLGGALAGFSYSVSNSLGNVRAVLNALANKSLVKVISSPSLMVLDNHTAMISVGNQQPVQGGSTITTGGTVASSIQYKDTGVNLSVTPSVNAGNIVTMQISQGVTDVGQIDAATGQRAFLQRQINSKVAVRSGEALVLGGLIRDNATTGRSGIPFLQDIPIIGNLFGTTGSNSTRTELLVVITPRVVRSDQDMREVSNELRDRMKSFAPLQKAIQAPSASIGQNAPASADSQPSVQLRNTSSLRAAGVAAGK